MNKPPGVLVANQIAHERVQRPAPAPRLRLLIELEPRRRVFFRNLADLLLSRRVPPVPISSRPGRFWDDVFVPSGAPWSSFAESMLWHLLLLILFVWGQSRVWVPEPKFSQRNAFHGTVTYYPPQSFPASGSRASSVRGQSRVKPTAHQPATQQQRPIPVTPEQRRTIVTPPDIKQATASLPKFLGSHAVTPMVPFSATPGPRRNALPGTSGVVAPPPDVKPAADQATARRLALPQASAVAPAPELGGPSSRLAAKALNTDGPRVVPPPPSIQNPGDSARAGHLSSLSGAGPNVVPPPPSVARTGTTAPARLGSQVVPPPPSVQGSSNSSATGRLSSLSGTGNVVPPPPSVQAKGPAPTARLGSQVVPPPPSVQGSGNSARLSSLSGAGNVVPPPPSVQNAGASAGTARAGSMAGTGSQVVPPPPSFQGAANSGRLSSLSGAGNVVPPPPSVQNAGTSAATARFGSMPGAGSQVVPPPPSADNSSAGGRLGSKILPGDLSGDGSQMMPPPASGTSNSGPTGLLQPMDPLPTDGSSATAPANSGNNPAAEEMPLGTLGLVFALPGTSFFSNFEVFVAKRRVGKDQLQFIKLVYEFLPYQRRLSEYDLNNLPPRVIKLRVTPDPSCNEALGQMIQSHADPTRPAAEDPKVPAELRASDPNAVLPCYRTTADDFQKAMSRRR